MKPLAALLAAGILFLPTSALGGATANSRITIKIGQPGEFFGKVRSHNNACTINREVVILRVRDGRDKRIGSDTTNGEGRYSVETNDFTGTWYAKAKESTPGLTCFSSKSERVSAGK